MGIDLTDIKKSFSQDLTDWQPIPFWSWNDKLDPEKLCRQIDWMKENNIGGFFMHARGGLKTEYLSEEWMDAIKKCGEHAEDIGMNAWAYDENGWPSGFAGGKLLEDPNNRDCYILHNIGAFDADATASYDISGDKLVRVNEGENGKDYLNIYINIAVSTADILNAEVVKKFIDLTHKAYKEQFGENFSKQIKGFFTDEPQYQRWNTPFTNVMFDYFEREYGIDLLDELGLLFVEKDGYLKFRYRYWKAMQSLMLEAFGKQIYAWCEENGVEFTGHYIEESSISGQMLCCAGIMPFYAYMHMPGIDWLGKETNNEIPARQLASVAAQFGKKQTLTETFACCGWQISPKDLKTIADFQCGGGVSTICHHLVPVSEYGQRKKDYPSHFSNVNPWIEREFADFNNYFTRLGYMISNGREQINVAMLHPIRSAYFEYKRYEEDSVRHIDDAFLNDCKLLSGAGVAYHLLDETLLAEHGFVKDGKIGCGKCSYDYLVLPHVLVTDASTEKLLREYVDNGGKVLCLGDVPFYCEAEPFDYSYLASNCTFEDIVAAQPFKVSERNIKVYNTYRELNGKMFLFVQNDDRENAHTQTYDFGEGINSFRCLDLFTLEEKTVPLTVKIEAGSAVMLFPDSEIAQAEEPKQEIRFALENAEVDFESNLMTVDHVSFSTDGKNYSKTYSTAGLFAKLLRDRYEGDIYLKYEFEVRGVPSKLRLAAECADVRECTLNGELLKFTEKSDKDEHLCIADASALVREGINEFVVKLHWYQNEMVYYALFGENVTESLRNCLVYDTDLEPIYLSGDFGVYTDGGYRSGADEPFVYADSFYIGAKPATVTEPTTDGFPFFAGSLFVKQNISLEEKAVALRIEGTWHIAYVKVNGKAAGKLIYERSLDISEFAVIGDNLIEIEFVIGNRNLLGPHHVLEWENGDVSPASFEISGEWVDGENANYADRYNLIKLDCK
ncbi:MAG: hypothetical protein II357_00935 [Clostridia bacterium]|nr:hypothetical protein [Clostridia bacterium]